MPRGKKSGRAASGDGSIRKKIVKKKNGKEYIYWEARYTCGFDPETGKQHSISGKTQAEVAQKLREITAEIGRGVFQEACKLTVGQWLDIWQRDYLCNVKPLTILCYEKDIKSYIKPALGPIKLDSLSPHMIQGFYNDLSRPRKELPGLSAKTIKCIHGVLHRALQQAVAIDCLRMNPSEVCTLPRIEKKEIKPLDSEGISAFMKAIQGHRFEAVYLVTLFTGLRRGEVCDLTWDCVNLESGTILVNKQLQNVPGRPGEFRLVSSKNGKSRTITAAPFVVDVLKRHKARQAEARLRAGPAWEDNGLVFCNELGERLSPHTVYHNFKRIMDSIGLPNTRLHDLRHP